MIFRGGYSYRKKAGRKLTGARLSVRIANVYNHLVRLPSLPIQIEKKERERNGRSTFPDGYCYEVRARPEAERGKTVSARADAGTLIPMQFGLCRLRKDSIPVSCAG